MDVGRWLKFWGERMALFFAPKDGNVFIENGIWSIIV